MLVDSMTHPSLDFLVDFINDEHDVDTVGHIFAIIMRDYYLIIVSTM